MTKQNYKSFVWVNDSIYAHRLRTMGTHTHTHHTHTHTQAPFTFQIQSYFCNSDALRWNTNGEILHVIIIVFNIKCDI